MLTEATAGIIKEICELNAKSGRENSDWHIGAIADAEQHLFKELKLPRDYRWCIYRRAGSAREAQAIVHSFWNIGFRESRAASPEPDQSAVHVFAYLTPTVITERAATNLLQA